MQYKLQTFTDEFLQCVFDKYVITYQNIWGKGVVRTDLLESTYWKTLGSLNDAHIFHNFLHKKYF